MRNILAIVGRPNVGKSTLFNRLIESRQAIVEESSGVTRDRHYGTSFWNGKEFTVIDTGGYVIGSDDIFEEEIRKQVDLAMDEADSILFVVDTAEGVHHLDQEVADLLRRQKKPVYLVANKVDNHNRNYAINEFYSLGLGEVFGISAVSGSGTGDLLDKIVENFDDEFESIYPDDIPKITVVGRPNVGKSSLINALISEERNIVTDIAGTTRDSLFTRYNSFGFDLLLVDTAGIRKKTKVTENIEFYSTLRSIRSIENSDVAIIMIDAENGFESQDMAIFQLAQRNHKGIVIVVNKWDLIEKDTHSTAKYKELIMEKIAPFVDVPILFTSVKNKQRLLKTLEVAIDVYKRRDTKIATSKLNELMLNEIEKYPPPAYKGKFLKIKYVTQLPVAYPSFAFFCNLPQYFKPPYKRFLENKLRKNYNFNGVPIEVYFRAK
ncbi:MAG: ribosome biogenesis GTPase Der [Bacteroidetes bacterium 4572_112]|nr:MAG: ribosome biogenesis GTPase Der [Bacteroidetes bacterium 4572_112]